MRLASIYLYAYQGSDTRSGATFGLAKDLASEGFYATLVKMNEKGGNLRKIIAAS
jgi:hypothetical protein